MGTRVVKKAEKSPKMYKKQSHYGSNYILWILLTY